MKKPSETRMAGLRYGSSIFLILCIISSTINLISSKSSLSTTQAALFVFGDSYFDVGNNNYLNTIRNFQSNYWPYGTTTYKFPTGRVADGRTIPDFIAEYAWLPLIPPYLQPGNNQFTYGVNFASAGAGALVETYPGLVIPLRTQLNNFNKVVKVLRSKLGDGEAKRILSRAVYIFHIGGNDYFYPFLVDSSLLNLYSKEQYVDFVIGNITSAIKEVYELGGRKFGFMNLGPYDCAPGLLIRHPKNLGSCFGPGTERIRLHNEKLLKLLRKLESKLSGFKYALHDFHTSLSERINNPSNFGFKEGKKACCGSGPFRGNLTCGGKPVALANYELCENASDYVFFDSFHLTEKTNEHTARLMWSGSTNVTGPYNLKTLFELRDV